MAKEDGAVAESKAKQRDTVKRATLEMLRNKKRPTSEFTITLPGEEGEPVEASLLFRALGSQDWDKLVTANPPTKAQQADGNPYNPQTFGPSLLAAVCEEPVISKNEWKEIWDSPDWNKGELMDLFWSAVNLCNKGLDVNPIDAD